MNLWKSASMALAAGVLGLAAGAAQAAMAPDVLVLGATNGSAAPGGTAFTSFTIGFSGTYEFTGVATTIEFNPALLSFNPLLSKVSVLGVERSLPDFAALLYDMQEADGSTFVAYGGEAPPGTLYFGAGFVFTGSMSLTGDIVVTTAFDLSPSFAIGSQTAVEVTQFDIADLNNGIVPLASAENPVLMTVTAVPEPESWLMLLAGMGLLGAVARRRVAHH